jgi:hypothetical protein
MEALQRTEVVTSVVTDDVTVCWDATYTGRVISKHCACFTTSVCWDSLHRCKNSDFRGMGGIGPFSRCRKVNPATATAGARIHENCHKQHTKIHERVQASVSCTSKPHAKPFSNTPTRTQPPFSTSTCSLCPSVSRNSCQQTHPRPCLLCNTGISKSPPRSTPVVRPPALT